MIIAGPPTGFLKVVLYVFFGPIELYLRAKDFFRS